MGKRDIDLERVVDDPVYRRTVIRELNRQAPAEAGKKPAVDEPARRAGGPGPRDDGRRINRG